MIGVQGNEAAQARVFTHDAQIVYTDGRTMWLDLDTLKGGSGYAVAAGVATSGTGVPAALTVDITSVDADGKITGLVINAVGASGTDNSVADIAGGGGWENNGAYTLKAVTKNTTGDSLQTEIKFQFVV